MKRFVYLAGFTAAAFAPFLALTAAHAEWVNDGSTFSVSQSTSHTEGGGGNSAAGTSCQSTAASSGSPPTRYWNYQTAVFTQDFHWNGGGTPSTSFTVPGSGKLDGSVITTGSVAGEASSGVIIGFINPTWAYPETAKTPSGNIPVSATGSTTSFNWSINTSAKGLLGSGAEFGASYNSIGKGSYTIGTPNP